MEVLLLAKHALDLVEAHIPTCVVCMCNKSPMTAPAGLLYPVPAPDSHGDSVAIDFVGPLPEDHGYNMLVTMTDHLGADICLVPCRSLITAVQFVTLFSITGTARMDCQRRLCLTATSYSCPRFKSVYTNSPGFGLSPTDGWR